MRAARIARRVQRRLIDGCFSSVAEWYVRKNDFAYLEKLWHDWSAPGWTTPREHLESIKKTFAASFPSPILHYRSGGFGAGDNWQPIETPTLYLAGAADGCVLPEIADGQEEYFSGEFKSEIISNAGHFLHLEQLETVNQKIIEWLKKD